MRVRFYPDVLALKPAAVIILAGTNDIARNNRPQTFEMIQHDIMAMTELAPGHGVKAILCALLRQPSHDHSGRRARLASFDSAIRARESGVDQAHRTST